MRRSARRVAAAVRSKKSASGVWRTARVTAVNTGPPPTLDLMIEDRWPVPAVTYSDAIDTPAVDDEVHVVTYGSGRRFVVARTKLT